MGRGEIDRSQSKTKRSAMQKSPTKISQHTMYVLSSNRRSPKRLLSTWYLLMLGMLLSIIALGANVFVALSLPGASSPSLISPQNFSSILHIHSATQFDDSEDRDMLHVVISRFMQLQPDLVALGEARLTLFETFCLPSMLKQQVRNFVWFIMTDPNLDSNLLRRMQDLLSPYPNFYLVLMNSKLVTPQNLTDMIDDRLFATGDIEFLKSLMFDENRPLLLETRLDADDALSGRTLLRIQDTARGLPVDSRGWQVICNNLHYEWRNGEITDNSNATVQTSGQLRIVMESICITAGYTLVRHRPYGSIEFPSWPNFGHHVITRAWPQCLGQENATFECWTRSPKYPAALRSRTATSAGMSRVQATPNDSLYDNQTDILWPYVERDFGILPGKTKATSIYLKSHLADIVAANLKGQWYVIFSMDWKLSRVL